MAKIQQILFDLGGLEKVDYAQMKQGRLLAEFKREQDVDSALIALTKAEPDLSIQKRYNEAPAPPLFSSFNPMFMTYHTPQIPAGGTTLDKVLA